MSLSELNLFRQAVLQAWNAVVICRADADAGYPVETANAAFCTMTGYALEELAGGSLKRLQGPETDPAVIERLRACLRECRNFEGSTINYRKDGTPYHVRWNISPVRDESGTVTHFVSVQQDISDYVLAERRNRLLARALDASSDPIVVTDLQSRIIFANAAYADITGYAAGELVGRTPAILRSGLQDESFYAELRDTLASGRAFRATFANRRRDGSLYHAEQSITPILDDRGRPSHYVSVSKDITERIQREQRLREAATRDKLTGLYNRHYGEHRLEAAVRQAREAGTPLAVILCDLDHFKRINDHFGHLAGDRVLQRVSQALRSSVRGADAVVRWGGEEFLVLLEDRPQARAEALAERLRARVEALADEEVGRVTLSLGLAVLAPGESPADLIARADAALYASKHGGRNRLTISPAPPPS